MDLNALEMAIKKVYKAKDCVSFHYYCIQILYLKYVESVTFLLLRMLTKVQVLLFLLMKRKQPSQGSEPFRQVKDMTLLAQQVVLQLQKEQYCSGYWTRADEGTRRKVMKNITLSSTKVSWENQKVFSKIYEFCFALIKIIILRPVFKQLLHLSGLILVIY